MKDKWDGKRYKENSEAQYESGIKAVGAINFNGDEKVLDIGCGDGRISKFIADKVTSGQVVGIDPSESMIHEARKNYSDVKNLSFIICSGEDFSFDFKFDVVTSFFAFHYVPDPLKALKRIFNVLKPGGRLVILTSGGKQDDIVEVLGREPWRTIFSEKPMKWYAKEQGEYEDLLKQVGFDDIQVKTEVWSRFYESRKDLLSWFMAWAPHVLGLDEKQCLQFSEELVENVSKGKEKDIEFRSPIVIIKACK